MRDNTGNNVQDVKKFLNLSLISFDDVVSDGHTLLVLFRVEWRQIMWSDRHSLSVGVLYAGRADMLLLRSEQTFRSVTWVFAGSFSQLFRWIIPGCLLNRWIVGTGISLRDMRPFMWFFVGFFRQRSGLRWESFWDSSWIWMVTFGLTIVWSPAVVRIEMRILWDCSWIWMVTFG